MLLSVFIPIREKNQDQQVNEMLGEESAKHVKMPQKILFPEEKESKSPETAYGWQSLLITKERGKKFSPTSQFSQILSWLPL